MSDGRDAVSTVPSDRWNIDEYFDPDPDVPGRMSTRWGGFLDQIDQFDAPFFGIARREAAWHKPQQRILLECVWEAIESAGCAPRSLHGTSVGVFVGMSTHDYHSLALARGEEAIDAYTATGTP